MRDVRITSLPTGAPSWRRAAWIALAVLLALAGVWWLYHRTGSGTGGGRAGLNTPFPVVASPVTTGNIDITYNALGTVTPLATVTVRSQISGQITQIAFKEGQMVKQGDLLVIVDPRPFQAALEQTEGTQAKDLSLLKQAQSDLARYQILAKQDSIAQQTVDDQAHLVNQYTAQAKVDQGAVDAAKLNLAYTSVTAPINGRVGLRQIDLGNYVTANDANGLVVLTQLHPITVTFSLPEDDLPAIMKRMSAGATLQVTAYDRSNTNKLATGTLAAVDSQIDTTTGTVKMRAQFDNSDGVLFPNQFVNVQVLVDTLHDTTVVPTAAVQRGAPGTFVYVVNADTSGKQDDDTGKRNSAGKQDNAAATATVKVTPIKIGPVQGESTAVTSGIAVGTQVVVDGADKLKDNAKVALRPESPKVPSQNPNTTAPGNSTTTPDTTSPSAAPAQPAPATPDQSAPSDNSRSGGSRRGGGGGRGQ
ncbi:MAG TPA: efflux RND transporter periplasmic adaptor subunit [Stellaceae bacterium]|jgi:multidrug efflux system membrane fusion protein|nr:efflux RND transporter periplasmic adaptor subunit [Stellaceae bacterium]